MEEAVQTEREARAPTPKLWLPEANPHTLCQHVEVLYMCGHNGLPHLIATRSRCMQGRSVQQQRNVLVMLLSFAQSLPVAQDISSPCIHDCDRWRMLQASSGCVMRSHPPAAGSMAYSLPARKTLYRHRCRPLQSSTRNEQAESASFKAAGDPLCESQSTAETLKHQPIQREHICLSTCYPPQCRSR